VAALLGFSGCGGVSKGDFVKQADNVCSSFRGRSAALRAQAAAAFAPKTLKSSPQQAAQTLLALQASGRDFVTALSKLKPPKSDRAIFRAYLDAIRAVDIELGAASQALARKQTTAFSTALANQRVYAAEAAGIAEGYGLKACTKSG
jgi:hypothetical protein